MTLSSHGGVVAESGPVLTGEVIDGKLEVKEMVGEGGMGSVYRVRHWEWNVDLALKVPRAGLLASEDERTRWIREAHTWIDLGLHPNIVPCWFIREWREIPVLFLDFMPGGSLKERLDDLDHENWPLILDWMTQAADGLGYAHHRGLVHRDVKPANILLDSQGNLCMTDFGLVALHQEIDDSGHAVDLSELKRSASLTATGTLMGTPQYASPEQWMGQKVTTSADIYALGVILFEMLTGTHPFPHTAGPSGLTALVTGHVQTTAPDVREVNGKVPERLAQIAATCLAKDPLKRPATVEDLRDLLTDAYAQVAGKAYKREVPQAATQRADALNNKAVSLWSLGDAKEAFSAWLEAARFDALHPEATFNRSTRQWLLGRIQPQEVEQRLQQVRQTHPRASAYLGYYHLSRYQPGRAQVALEAALRDPNQADDGTVWRALGDARMAQRDFEGAEKAFQEALKRIPEDRASQTGLKLAGQKTRFDDGVLRFPSAEPIWAHQHQPPPTSMNAVGDALLVAGPQGLARLDSERPHTLWNASISGIKKLGVSDGWVVALDSTNGGTWALQNGAPGYSLSDGSRFFALLQGGKAVAGLVDLKVVSVADGARSALLLGHDKQVNAVAVSESQDRALSASSDRTVRLWKLSTGECLGVLRGHRDYVEAVAILDDASFAVTGGRDRTVRAWLLETGECFGVYPDHPGSVIDLSLTPDRRVAVAVSLTERGFHTTVWDLRRGSAILARPGRAYLHGNDLFIFDQQEIVCYNLPTGINVRAFVGHLAAIEAVTVCGKQLFSVDQSGQVVAWEASAKPGDPPLLLTRASSHGEAEKAREEFQALLSSAREGDVSKAYGALVQARSVPGYEQDPEALELLGAFWNKLERRELGALWERARLEEPSRRAVSVIALSPDGGQALSAAGNVIRLWDLASGSCVRGLNGHRQEVSYLCFCDQGRQAVSAAADRTVRLWDPSTGQCLHTFTEADDTLCALAVSRDGTWAAAAGYSGKLFLFDLQQRRVLTTLAAAGQIRHLRFSEDGRWLLSSGKRVRRYAMEGTPVLNAELGLSCRLGRLSPSGRLALLLTDDGDFQIWDAESKRCLRVLDEPRGLFTNVAFNSDGRLLVTADRDGFLALWGFPDGPCFHRWESPEGFADLDLTPDGRFLMVANKEGAMNLWELDWAYDAERKFKGLEARFPKQTWWQKFWSRGR